MVTHLNASRDSEHYSALARVGLVSFFPAPFEACPRVLPSGGGDGIAKRLFGHAGYTLPASMLKEKPPAYVAESVKQIAASTGFGTVETLHRAFQRCLSVTPLQLSRALLHARFAAFARQRRDSAFAR